jgi:hypothetical protein
MIAELQKKIFSSFDGDDDAQLASDHALAQSIQEGKEGTEIVISDDEESPQ